MRVRISFAIITALVCVNFVEAQTVWEDFTSPQQGLSTEFRPTPFLGTFDSEYSVVRMRRTELVFNTPADENAHQARLKQLAEKILLPQAGFYLGDLVIYASESPVQGPVSVQLQYYAVDAQDIAYPPLEETLPENFLFVPHGPLGKACGSYSYQDLPAEIPLVVNVPFFPVSSYGAKETANGISVALVTYVVRDVEGNFVSSGVLPAVYSNSYRSGYIRYNRKQEIGGESDDEKENSSFSGLVVKKLPDGYAAYNKVESIWLTHKLLDSCTGQENLLRRLLMTGIKVSGQTSVVERLQAMVGLPSATNESGHTSFKRNNYDRWDQRERSGYLSRSSQADAEKTVFDTGEDVFDKRCSKRFSTYSLSCFGIFLLGAAVILIFVFCRLKGERRIIVWWLLPVWTIVFSIVALVGGLLVLDRRSKTDYTELRFAVSDWPEMLCHAEVKTISFTTENYEWSLPVGADLADEAIVPDEINRYAKHCDITESPSGLRVLAARESCKGIKKKVTVNWFEKAEFPIQFSESTVTGAVPVVSTSLEMDDVYVRMDDTWYQLGPMKAGEKREVNKTNAIPPEGAATVDWGDSKVCENCGRVHGPKTGKPLGYPEMVDHFEGVITLGVKHDTPLRAMPVWKGESVEKGRTIWVTKW